MTTELKLMIHTEDLSLFYALASKYHQDRNAFKQIFESRFMGNDEILCRKPAESKGQPEKVEMGLFERVSEECTCGHCYNLFARNDRVPWRNLGHGKYINAKHGTATILKSCKLHRAKMSGYIYLTRAEEASTIASKKQRLELNRLENEVEAKKSKTKRETAAADMDLKKKVQEAAQEHEAKLQKFKNELRNREEKLRKINEEQKVEEDNWVRRRNTNLTAWKQKRGKVFPIGHTGSYEYYKVVEEADTLNGWIDKFEHSDEEYAKQYAEHWPFQFTKHVELKKIMDNVIDLRKSVRALEAT